MTELTCERVGCFSDVILQTGREVCGKYICDRCRQELLDFKATWRDQMQVWQVRQSIEAFLRTPPGSYVMLDKDGIDREFQKIAG